ncbi:unnamed protein product [Mortierella alpina]
MIKIDTLIWLAIVATVIVHGLPTGLISNPIHLINASNVGTIVFLDTLESQETLADRLRERYESKLSNTSSFTSYVLARTHQWKVWKLNSCQAEIRAPTAISSALFCDPQSPGPCQLAIQYIDTQTVSTQDGFTVEFSVSTSEGVSGVFEASASASVSGTHTATHIFSHGKAFTYTFPVAVGKMCTPSIVSYHLRCRGTPWDILNNPESELCSDFTQRFKIDFNDSRRWFVDPKDDDWFQYVYSDKIQGDQLFSFHVRNKEAPQGCEDIVQLVDQRGFVSEDHPSQEHFDAFLSLDNGDSLSAVSCIY